MRSVDLLTGDVVNPSKSYRLSSTLVNFGMETGTIYQQQAVLTVLTSKGDLELEEAIIAYQLCCAIYFYSAFVSE